MAGAAETTPLAGALGALTAEDSTQLNAALLSLRETLVSSSPEQQGGSGCATAHGCPWPPCNYAAACVVCVVCRALIQPLCAILGGLLSARDDPREGPAASVAAAGRLVAPIRTAESILACLHAIFEREDVSDPSQARLAILLACCECHHSVADLSQHLSTGSWCLAAGGTGPWVAAHCALYAAHVAAALSC